MPFQQESGAWLAKLNEDGITLESERKVWAGNAKTCAMRKVRGEQKLFLGVEPADVLTSDDMGETWRGTDSFAAIPERSGPFLGTSYSQHHIQSDLSLSSKIMLDSCQALTLVQTVKSDC